MVMTELFHLEVQFNGIHEIRIVATDLNRSYHIQYLHYRSLTKTPPSNSSVALGNPWGVTGDIHGNGFVSDHRGNAIYKVVDDNVTLFAG